MLVRTACMLFYMNLCWLQNRGHNLLKSPERFKKPNKLLIQQVRGLENGKYYIQMENITFKNELQDTARNHMQGITIDIRIYKFSKVDTCWKCSQFLKGSTVCRQENQLNVCFNITHAGEKLKKLNTSNNIIYFIMVKLLGLSFLEINLCTFAYTAVLFSLSKEFQEKCRFILLLVK